MRKKDKEISDKAHIEAIIERAQVLRLGLYDGSFPYVIPMNYGYAEGSFFLHCAKEGKKIDILKKDDRVCIEIDLAEEIVRAGIACKWTTRYRSVICFGRARFISEEEEKRRGLSIIMKHYSGGADHEYPDEIVRKVEIIQVAIERMSGKVSLPS